jgi:hypothetical protein
MAFHTLEMISKVADEELVKATLELFEGNKKKCEEWFNSEIKNLGYETPYELCKKGKEDLIKDIIYGAQQGTFS